MILPLILVFFAAVSAAVAAYGTSPSLASLHNGIHYIEMARRLQWPLLTLSVLLALTLLVLIITGKKKVWWLLGLAPTGAMFLQIFVTGAMINLHVVEQPPLLPAADAQRLVKPGEYVVGLTVGDKAVAIPYRQLAGSPVVLLSHREKRVAVLWSQYANRALAFYVNRQIKAREMDVVSQPGNALLVYNARLGQFINGVTGLTPDGQIPYGFSARVPTDALPWEIWLAQHPQTLVTDMPTLSTALTTPAAPRYPLKAPMPADMSRLVVLFPATQPVAVPEENLTAKPLNLELASLPVVAFRDPQTHKLRVFERKVNDQPFRFIPNPSTRRAAKGVFMLDTLTNSGWNTNGVAVDGDGQIIGSRLTPVVGAEQGQYLGVLREWYPELTVIE